MLFSAHNAPEPQKTNTPQEADRIDRAIRIAVIAVIALSAVFIINMLSTRIFMPSSNYKNGIEAMQQGRYAEAMECLRAAGDYKDAQDQLARAKQLFANQLAGKENALFYTSEAMPWMSVTGDGCFSFDNSRYEDVMDRLPNAGTLLIPDVLDEILVTAIEDKAFLNANRLTSVVLPDKVTVIPESCFYNAEALASVTLPASLQVISQRAFINCYELKSVVLPAGVREIGLRAFNNCYSLTSADLSACSGLTRLESFTFSECIALTTVSLPSSLTFIGENAFISCDALKTVRFAGTKEQWNAIEIASGNEALAGAQIIFGGAQ